MDWILSEVVELLKDEIEMTEHLMDMCEDQKKFFKDQFSSKDTFEVAKHEFWRGKIAGLKNKKNALRNILDSIYEMIDEEAGEEKAYSDELRQLRGEH